jgi:hypothetical protein
MIRKTIYLWIAILSIQPIYLIHVRAAADAVTASTKKIGGCHIEQFGVYNALSEISKKAGVTIGVNAIEPEKEVTIIFDFPGGTVADLLNMFQSKAPNYKWEEENGIIHVSRNDARVSLTDVVMSYPGAVQRTREQIWEDIAQRPEISAWMNSAHCSRGELFHGKEFRNHNNPIDIVPGSITLAELLDQVAVKSGAGYWAVLQSSDSGACRIYILVT